MKKDIVYVDIEDDIAAVIDKVRLSRGTIVALVLPKRANVVQSVVNMKLLKKAAGEARKQLVLVTTEASLLPLAGTLGIYVAASTSSTPSIPKKPLSSAKGAETVISDSATGKDEPEVTAASASASTEALQDEVEELKPFQKTVQSAKSPRNKKLKIPDFNNFRVRFFLILAVCLVLVTGLLLSTILLPSATINITTSASPVGSEFNAMLDGDAKELDNTNKIVPAVLKKETKTESEKSTATGTKDIGTPSTGQITIVNCGTSEINLPSGSSFNSGELSYISNEVISIPKSSYSNTDTGFVCDNNGKKTFTVSAKELGEKYNQGPKDYTIPNQDKNVTVRGGDMTGGTSKVATVVTQADIDAAKQKLLAKLSGGSDSALNDALKKDGYYPIRATFKSTVSEPAASAKVDEPVGEVTLSATASASMLGIKPADLETLIKTQLKGKFDPAIQEFRGGLLDDLSMQQTNRPSDSNATVAIKHSIVIGPKIDAALLRSQVGGKKRGDIESMLRDRPGVKDIEVRFSPFWVFSAPKKAGRVTIIIDGKKI